MRSRQQLRLHVVVLAGILVGLISVPVSAKTVYVSTIGSDSNNGLTWATAKKTVQAGLNAAVSGDQIWVAAGTYVERITLKAGAALYGGFAGSETSLTQRNWVTNKTILDGNKAGSVVTSHSGATAATRIDGFTIRNGTGTVSGSYTYGGGVYCSTSSPTIANSTISDNTAASGGGISCVSSSSPAITNNLIAGNNGSGIHCANASSPMIASNVITRNSAPAGAGIYSATYSSPKIRSNTISGNAASDYGGGIYCSGGYPTITNNTIAANSANSGGGIYCSDSSSLTIANTIVAFNSSGVYTTGSGTASLRYNCAFGNRAYNYSGVTDPTGTKGNISADPKLASLAYGNTHIQPESPCVNAGDYTAVPPDWPADIDGQSRIMASEVDIGADESDGTVWIEEPSVIVRVSPNGDDANDGSSWSAAKRTVQAGINAAALVGGEVWVQAGTYRERITLHPFAHMYGGFAGTESTRDSRDWVTNGTILDGQKGGSVVTIQAGERASTIDGFTIRNGTGTLTYWNQSGGGIYCSGSSPTIANNTITGNTVNGAGNPPTALGGGISCYYSSPTIINNTISGNAATSASRAYGGGVFCYASSPTIANSTIAGNTVSDSSGSVGGGIYCDSGSPTIANTIVAFNSSGIYKTGSGTLTLRYNCVFGNVAYNYSGLTDPTGASGNISVDPRLAGLAYGKTHIQPDSPCVDTGDDAVVQPGWLDIDGQSRIMASHVDMGADESDGTVWIEEPSVIVRVSPNGDDANDGSSWATAKQTVQAGINAAALVGGQVWVQGGTYRERITLHPFAHVYGGFAGTESTRDLRDWVANVTVLDGQQEGTVVTVLAGHRTSTIDGFTVCNGSGTLSGSYLYGGGIYCSSASPKIINNTISKNIALGYRVYGGGIYCSYSSPLIANNTITGNASNGPDGAYGGGIYCSYSSPTITNNMIAGNLAASAWSSSPVHGGGICCNSSSSMIANNTITNNSADIGGGIDFQYSSGTLTNTIIAFNSSGIYKTVSGTVTLQYNCVYGNTAYDYSGVTDPTRTNGNISADPKLADRAYGNMHIQPDSPCRDAGNDAVVQVGWLDIDGQSRIAGLHVDIGADESDGTVWPGGPYATIRVSPDGDDANDGSSWVAAKQTVQAGIDAAASAGGEVWVQAGTYFERVTLCPFSHVYGGFAGKETGRDSRDWVANLSILDGRQGGSVVTVLAGEQASTMNGFTIRNGTGTQTGSGRDGGGIYCSNCSPTITNNTITSNTAPSNGGGLWCDYSSPVVANNTIIGNSAVYGGGVYCSGGSPRITNNTIAANYGAGIHCSSSSPMIANTAVAFNSSGIAKAGSGTPILRYNCVYGNTAYNYAGVTDPTGTEGNISADPKPAGIAYGNTHIQPDSPCRDAGDDTAVKAGWLDIDGQARTQGTHVDIGADELDGTVWPDGPYVIVRVRPDGDDANDGSSWTAAKRTVQAGIDAAAPLGGEVWVRAGTYSERITLRSFAHVYGGFDGTESARDSRDWLANFTTLNGEQAGSVVTILSGHRASTIDGFTVRNGTGTLSDSNRYGGGVYCRSSSPTISNNRITGNSVSGTNALGGGIYCYSASPMIANNTITGNTSRYAAGGIYCAGSSSTIVNSTIASNAALFYGGGIYCVSSGVTITNATIVGNTTKRTSGEGGGIYCGQSSGLTITNTITAFNSSGVYKESGPGTPLLRYDCVYANAAYNFSGVADPTGTNGNFSADPKLASYAYGNMRIQPDSPCVNAGDDAAVQAGWVDIDGQPRILGSHVDIGADESGGTVWPQGPYVIVRVTPNGDDANDGSSWAAAKRTVQAALDAVITVGGDVWVQAGTYHERIALHPFAHVYGGFGGTESTRNSRDWVANGTILDGQQGGSVVTVQAGEHASTIDGFTIRNGSGTVSGAEEYPCGGGIYCTMSSPMISHNRITDNTLSSASSTQGGGIYCYNATPTISDNTIAGNSARAGGGIYCGYYSSATISNNTISGNTTSGVGGGICCTDNSSARITSNVIAENSASGSNCGGGGIYCQSSSLMIADNLIIGNSAGHSASSTYAYGGGIYCYLSPATIVDNTIAGNVVDSSVVGGGAGLYCGSYPPSPTIADNMIVGNAVVTLQGFGGGIYSSNCMPTIANNTISGNTANSGGGMYSSNLSPTIINTVIAFNSSGIYRSSGTVTLRYNCAYGNAAYNYSGVTDPTGTNGNISADPLFVRPASPGPDGQWGTADDDYGDLRLQSGSPCIDAGDNAGVPADTADLDGDGNITEPMPFDLAGKSRFFDVAFVPDTGLGTAPIVDMGAYEFVMQASPDLDGDGDIDAADFDRFLAAFGHQAGQQGYNMLADFDMDGTTTFVDYQRWLQEYRAANNSPQAPAPLQVLGDFGLDGHVDATDADHFEACATGPGMSQTDEGCRDADLDRDGDVDQSDFGLLQRCFSGPDRMVDPSCKY